jgi:hypothetical protein
MPKKTLPVRRAEKVYVQPPKQIMSRHRDHAGPWVVLECGHIEPGSGLDFADATRCQQCDPVHRDSPAALGTATTVAMQGRRPPVPSRPVPDVAYDRDH